MSDNIQVAIRVRPLNARENSDSQGKKCIQVNNRSNSVAITVNSSTRYFKYDYVGDEDVSQEELFESIGKPIASSCLCGYNGSIFAYGQTGSGKTYTIMGAFSDATLNFQYRGILPRCLEYIFAAIKREIKKNSVIQYLVKCSFLEIYNEQINDLLSPEQRNLQIREDIKKGAYVENLQEETVSTFDDTFEVMEKGVKNRHIGSTSMNKESSRSHSVFTLQIESKEKREDVWNFKNSFFHLIDLAGSERQKLTEAFGDRLKEAGMINKSLSSLGNVINSLVEISEGKSRHVPYRDSKLTFLLKDSLGGNSKTCIIANISPSCMSYGETLSTLRFAERAKLVTNKAVINEDTMGTVLELKEEVKRLKNLLKQQQDTPMQGFNAEYSERVKAIEGLLEQNVRIRLQSENALQQEIDERDAHINNLMSALEKCEKKINGDRKTIKIKDEQIKKMQKNEGVNENRIVLDLKEEVECLRRENENHPGAARLVAENERLRFKMHVLENELKENVNSLTLRLKESQDFTEKLQVALRKSVSEREQLHILLEEYSKKTKADVPIGQLELATAKKQINDLKKALDQERTKVMVLEEQLNAFAQSQMIEESMSSKFSTSTDFAFPRTDTDTSQWLSKKALNSSVSGSEKPLSDFQRYLEENDDRTQKILILEQEILSLKQENKSLKKYELENFRFEEEIEKLKDELMRKDNRIEELQNEVETIIAENEFLSTQFIEFGQQLGQKDRKISELTEKLSFRANKNQIEENIKMKTELEDLKNDSAKVKKQLEEINEEFELSVNSRENLIIELKRLQYEERSLYNECTEMRSKLLLVEKENEQLKGNVDELSSDLTSVSGTNNLNQKIKLHAKMKEENNKLKDQNYLLRKEIRTKNEKIEFIMKKLDVALKGNSYLKESIESDILQKEKMEVLEKQVKDTSQYMDELNSWIASLPFTEEIKGLTISEKILSTFNYMSQDLQNKEEKIENLDGELIRKAGNLKVLESEVLLLKQKISKKSTL